MRKQIASRREQYTTQSGEPRKRDEFSVLGLSSVVEKLTSVPRLPRLETLHQLFSRAGRWRQELEFTTRVCDIEYLNPDDMQILAALLGSTIHYLPQSLDSSQPAPSRISDGSRISPSATR